MLYIAYGSNLNRAQMKARCPKAKVYGKAILKGYRLEYHGVDGDAKATLSKDTESEVPVVIWEFSAKDEETMDVFEGYPNVYFKKSIFVKINGKKKKCLVYIKKKSPIGRPSRKYANTIRWGYRDFNLDSDYFEESLIRNSEDFYSDNIEEVRPLPTKRKVKVKKSITNYNFGNYYYNHDYF